VGRPALGPIGRCGRSSHGRPSRIDLAIERGPAVIGVFNGIAWLAKGVNSDPPNANHGQLIRFSVQKLIASTVSMTESNAGHF
jgi:hypothetical protein